MQAHPKPLNPKVYTLFHLLLAQAKSLHKVGSSPSVETSVSAEPTDLPCNWGPGHPPAGHLSRWQ